MKTVHRVHISRAPGEVFAYLEVVANETQWRESIVASGYHGSSVPGVGVDGYTEVEMGAQGVSMAWTVTAYEPGTYVAWSLDGNPWNGGGSYRVSAHPAGCIVEARLEVRLKGWARLAEPILGLAFRRGLRGDLTRLAARFSDQSRTS